MKETAINSVYIVMHETDKNYDGEHHGYVWEVFADKREAEKEAIYLNENYAGKYGKEDFFFVIEEIVY